MDDNLIEGAKQLISYYRQFPHIFVEEYFGIKLYDFQKIALYEMMHTNYFVFTATRNCGKTWLTAIFVLTRCILYPKTKVIVTASERQQSSEIFTKILDLMKNSQMLREEISNCTDSSKMSKCSFWNGSTIVSATMSHGSRHFRANVVVVDEYVKYDPTILQEVISAFLGDHRFPLYLSLPKYQTKEYEYLKEEDTEMYLSSAGHKSSWAYNLFDDAFKQMVKGNDNYFVCAIPYQTVVKCGLRKKDLYIKEASKSTVDMEVFDAEYGCKWITQSESAFYKFDILDNCRTLQKAQYTNDVQSFLADKDKRFKINKRKSKEDKAKDIIIIGADIASMGGRKNDRSAFCVLKLIEKNKVTKSIVDGKEVTSRYIYYDRELIYIESHEGMLLRKQAERLKELYTDFDASYIVVDAQNAGISIVQELALPTNTLYEEYQPMRSIYDDDYAMMCQYKDAVKCVVPYKAYAQSNHDDNDSLLHHLVKGHVKLLIDDASKMKNFLFSIKDFDNEEVFDRDLKNRIMSPYRETTALIKEMIALERVPTSTGLIKLKEASGKRKDRFSAFLYANAFADELEQKLITTSDYEQDDDIIDLYYF